MRNRLEEQEPMLQRKSSETDKTGKTDLIEKRSSEAASELFSFSCFDLESLESSIMCACLPKYLILLQRTSSTDIHTQPDNQEHEKEVILSPELQPRMLSISDEENHRFPSSKQVFRVELQLILLPALKFYV